VPGDNSQSAPNRSPVPSRLNLPRLRRLSQVLFLALFVAHVCSTEYRGTLHPGQGEIRLPFPVRAVLASDPLVGVANALSTRALYHGLIWGLLILIPTLFLGRFFCGWMCPLGTLCHFLGNIRSPAKSGPRRIASNRYKSWQSLKYYLLIALLASALFGGALVGVMDPLSLAIRAFALSLLPGTNYALNSMLEVLGRSPWWGVRIAGTALHYLFFVFLSFKQPYFRQAFPIGLLFAAILVMNLRVTRWWCRALCPLGALLGLVSRWSVFGLEKNSGRLATRPNQCTDCNRCLLDCQGGDDPIPAARWRKAECHLCMNCVDECPEHAIQFRFFPRTAGTIERADVGRRQALASLAAGAAAIPLLRANAGFAVEPGERLIRPPASVDESQFLGRCIRCGQCMKICPSNALHPAFTEAGWEGFWTPVLVPRVGYCEPSCSLCGQACPTGAIQEFTSRDKAWVSTNEHAAPIRLGTAFYDRGRCLPWAMGTECIVCEEWCPTSPKAVYLRAAEVIGADGNSSQVRQPYIDPQRCVGCGACEYACPVRDRPAVYVTSVGESRSSRNQLLLKPSATPEAPLPADNEAPGWVRQGDVRVFEAADLWKYVDGDAERYLRAGVQRTFTAGYLYRNRIEAVVDVHVMAAADAARQFLESEPAQGSRPIAIGDAGRSYGQSVTFRQGRYFVRLVAYQDSPDVETALESLAQAIGTRLLR